MTLENQQEDNKMTFKKYIFFWGSYSISVEGCIVDKEKEKRI